MNVLVDTCVWSLALRRTRPRDDAPVVELAELLGEGRVLMVGAIRQELLSGVRGAQHFASLRNHLRAFPDVALETADHEEAAALSNRCRAKGIQGSGVDLLLCAIAMRRRAAILTTDEDFVHYATVVPIVLHVPRTTGA